MANNKYGLPELRQDTIKFLSGIPKNADTEALLNKILPLFQQNFRDREFEDLCKSIRSGQIPGSTPKPEPKPATEYKQEPITEKKIVNPTDAEVVESKPIEEKPKDITNEMAILDLYTLGLEKAKEQYPKPTDLKKALSTLGITAKGNYEDLWAALTAKFNEINQ